MQINWKPETGNWKLTSLRVHRLSSSLSAGEAAVIAVPVNIYYLTGRIVNGYVYVDSEGHCLVFYRRPQGIEEDGYIPIRKPEQMPEILREKGVALPAKLLLETDELSYGDCLRLATAFGGAPLGNATKLLRQLRAVKDSYELDCLRQGASMQSEALQQLAGIYEEGMDDHRFAVECERIFRLKGCLGQFRTFGVDMEAFMGSVLAGDNAGEPSPYDFALGGQGMHPSLPLGHNGTLLVPGMSVMVDINGNFNGYIADQSRTFSIGRLSDEAYRAHEVSIEIHRRIAQAAKPGAVCEDLYQIALDAAAEAGLSQYFMGHKQQAKFVGHGIGLQINELPVLCARNKATLQCGNVIAIEPKFIIPGTGAVGIENSYIVGDDGLEKITTATEEIIDLKNQ